MEKNCRSLEIWSLTFWTKFWFFCKIGDIGRQSSFKLDSPILSIYVHSVHSCWFSYFSMIIHEFELFSTLSFTRILSHETYKVIQLELFSTYVIIMILKPNLSAPCPTSDCSYPIWVPLHRLLLSDLSAFPDCSYPTWVPSSTATTRPEFLPRLLLPDLSAPSPTVPTRSEFLPRLLLDL